MIWNQITSRQNPAVKAVASLARKKERDREGVFVAEGSTLLSDLCRQGLCPRQVFLSTESSLSPAQVEEMAPNARGFLLSPEVFEKITEEKGSEGILSVFSRDLLPAFPALRGSLRLIALENVQDPGNVGTILRTAASLGIDGALLCGCADPFSSKAIRASMGAIAHIPLRFYPDVSALMDEMDAFGISTVAATLAEDSVPIGQTQLTAPICVLVGNEGQGLSRRAVSRAAKKCIIPIRNLESLNVAAAATVFLWEIVRREKI